jgi:tripartite-type tricarboxylate transporter receptor subunit TctC
MNRRKLIGMALGALAAAGGAMSASAADWPKGPIQVVVSFGAGGDTDYNARILSKYLEPILGVSMPVVNITGAGGTVGARQVLRAKPDGQTVLFFNTSFLASTATGMIDFSFKDFDLVGIAAEEPGTLIVVPASAPWKSMKDLIEATKKNPGTINVTTNTGATTYMVASELNQKAGAKFNFVDVGGAAGRLTAVLGGNVDVSQNPIGQVLPYIKKGELRALATLGRQRTDILPDVPTLTELGYDVNLQLEYFYLFPKGTPKSTIEKFAGALQQVVEKNPEYAEQIYKAYYQKPHWVSPEPARARLEALAGEMQKISF